MTHRADAHRAFCAAYVSLVPETHPDEVERAFARWWAREGGRPETAMEYGERFHREVEASYSRGTMVVVRCVPGLTYQPGMRVRLEHTVDTAARVEPCSSNDPASIGTVKRIDPDNLLWVHMDPPPTMMIDESKMDPRVLAERVAKLDEEKQKGLFRPILQVHDEIWGDVPTNLTNAGARPAYRCENKSCPERPAIYTTKAPKCYTCDRPMSLVAAAGDLLLSRDGDLEMQLGGIASVIERLQQRLASSMAMPLALLQPLRTEPDLMKTWYGDADKMAREMLNYPGRRRDPDLWGPSPLEQLAELRRITPQAWGRYIRGENPPRQIPRKPNKEEGYRVGDAIRHQILIGTGETLDKIGRIALGLFRKPAEPGTDLHAETDESFRERMLDAMEPRRLPPGGEWFADSDAGVPYWETKPDARVREHKGYRGLKHAMQLLNNGRGTEAEVRHAFGMLEAVREIKTEMIEPGHVEVSLSMHEGTSRREIEDTMVRAREIAREKMAVGVECTIVAEVGDDVGARRIYSLKV